MAKYREWLTPEGLELLSGWARSGMIDEEIARRCGCSTSTLYAWKAKYPEIDEALKRGKEVIDYAVENALLANALSGNVTAQIYWLNNRMADRWRAKPNSETGPDVEDLTPLARMLNADTDSDD